MKAKFVFLAAAGLFLATASQAQFHGNDKDRLDGNTGRHEMAYDRNTFFRDQREWRKDKRELRYDRRELRKDRRHHRHHHYHGHRPAHRAF